MKERCALDSLLSAGGPVRVAVRPCCLAALVGRRRSVSADAPGAADAPGSHRPGPGPRDGAVGAVGAVALVRAVDAGSAAGASLFCEAAEVEMRVSP